MPELETVVTFLEMKAESIHHVAPPSNLKLMLLRAENITLDFYRFLYGTVGRDFNWYDRRYLTDAELAAEIHGPGVEIWVMYVSGQPAGYFELAPRAENVMELEYFGVIPEFHGRGLGKWLLAEAIRAAWVKKPGKLITQTCTLDGPRALPHYQKMGFTPYAQEAKTMITQD
jgi:GNAT superfamily N-acetyltransferase